MFSKINKEIETDSNYYFFNLLSDRFQSLNTQWAELLSKKFGKLFKPIAVLPFQHNVLFEEENYIALPKQEDQIDVICAEDLNHIFSENEFVQSLLQKLLSKQGKVFMVSFTSTCLTFNDPRIIIIGPDPHVSKLFEHKVNQIETFITSGLSINETTIYKTFDELIAKQKTFPFFLTGAFSSGGSQSKIIYKPEELSEFHDNLRPVNKKEPLVVTRFIDNIDITPNVTALVTNENQTVIISISDQLLRDGNKYLGNVYPTRADTKTKDHLFAMTKNIGNSLSAKGFRGLFGVDFIVTTDGYNYPIDLNPRRQGGYFCNAMMSITSQKINLMELELNLALNEPLPEFTYEDFQGDYCWAHSKLTPFKKNMKIKKIFESGKPRGPFTNIGSTYAAIYYPKDAPIVWGNPGFYITSGDSYEAVKNTLLKETDEIISTTYTT